MATAAAIGSLEPGRYSRVAILLHWVIAALILVNLYLGLFHEDMSKPVRATMMFYHKAIGLTVLALTLLRLAWRLAHRPPPYDAALKGWEVGVARATHWTFYALLIALPLTGWLLVSTGGKPISWFGLFDIPALPVSHADGPHDAFDTLHGLFGYAMLLLVLLHVAGAIRHQLRGHRQVFGRMAPWRVR
ncbi:MAG: cytochrome b [Alphaproteobacteria bacterium]|nr:cytochrome b [Alphaproteobacteria bacterium]